MNNAMICKEAEYNYGKIDVGIANPGKCQTDHGWDNWHLAFVNKLNATLGAANVPIDYVARPDWDEDDELFLTDDEKRQYEMPLEGENFKHDNKLVFQMLKLACIKSDAWAWIRSYDRAADGRKAWLALVQHFERLHYKDEKVFPFEKFITKLKENFNVLEKDKHEDLSGRQRLNLMTKAIRSSDTRVLAGLVNVHQNFRYNFDEAANFMSG